MGEGDTVVKEEVEITATVTAAASRGKRRRGKGTKKSRGKIRNVRVFDYIASAMAGARRLKEAKDASIR